MTHDDDIARHKAELLSEHPDRTAEEWVLAALEASERDFQMVNRLLVGHLHPLTWTPPLVQIALEKIRAEKGGP